MKNQIHLRRVLGRFFLLLTLMVASLMAAPAAWSQSKCGDSDNPSNEVIRATFASLDSKARSNFKTAAGYLRTMRGKKPDQYTQQEKTIARVLQYHLKIDDTRQWFILPHLAKTFEKAAALPKLGVRVEGDPDFPSKKCNCNIATACVGIKRDSVDGHIVEYEKYVNICKSACAEEDPCKVETVMHEMLHLVGLYDHARDTNVGKDWHPLRVLTTDAGTMAELCQEIAAAKADGSFGANGVDQCGKDASRINLVPIVKRRINKYKVMTPVASRVEGEEDTQPEEPYFHCGFEDPEPGEDEWSKARLVMLEELDKAIEEMENAQEEAPANNSEEKPKEEQPKEEEQPAPTEEAPQDGGN